MWAHPRYSSQHFYLFEKVNYAQHFILSSLGWFFITISQVLVSLCLWHNHTQFFSSYSIPDTYRNLHYLNFFKWIDDGDIPIHQADYWCYWYSETHLFYTYRNNIRFLSPFQGCLGGVVVNVLATGPKDCGFKPGQGDRFLRAIKIHSTPSFRMGSKARGPTS
jgi:hypothetical protein